MSYPRHHANMSTSLSIFKKSPEKDTKPLENYHLLYPDEKIIIKEYPADKKNHQKTRNDFKRQFVTLSKAIDKWGMDNQCTTTRFQENIRHLQGVLFADGFADHQQPFYFNNIKANLEMIWFQLHNQNLSLEKRKKAYKNLCFNLRTCAPGLYIHIENSLLLLTRVNSVEWWLTDLRTHLVNFYADRHNDLLEIKDGDSIHTNIAFWNEATKNGWNTHFRSKIPDPFKTHVGIEKEDLHAFTHYFKQEYTRAAITECIKVNMEEQFNSLVSKYGLEKINDWIPYHYPLTAEFEVLLKELGMKGVRFLHIYETKEEDSQIKLKLSDIIQALLINVKEVEEQISCDELYEMSRNNILIAIKILETPYLLQKLSSFAIGKIGCDHLDAALFILRNSYLSSKLTLFEIRMIAESHGEAAMYCLQNAYLCNHFKSFDLIVLAKKHPEVAMFILSKPYLLKKAERYFLASIALKNPEVAMTILSTPSLVNQLYTHEIIALGKTHYTAAKYIFETKALLLQFTKRECDQILYKYPNLHPYPSEKKVTYHKT